MKLKLPLYTVLAALSCATAQAQLPGSSPAGVSAGLAKLFKEFGGFSAKAEVQELDGAKNQTTLVPMEFSLLETRIRAAIDMSQVKSQSISPDEAAQLRQMGLAQVVTIIRPDKKLVYVIYPDQKSAISVPLPKEDSDASEKEAKIDKTALGKETIDGHACTKNNVIVSNDQGKMLEAVTWEAADLKNFPIQIQTRDSGKTTIVHYRDVRLEKPALTQFDPPKEYVMYKDMMELMQGVMKKNGGASPQPATPGAK